VSKIGDPLRGVRRPRRLDERRRCRERPGRRRQRRGPRRAGSVGRALEGLLWARWGPLWGREEARRRPARSFLERARWAASAPRIEARPRRAPRPSRRDAAPRGCGGSVTSKAGARTVRGSRKHSATTQATMLARMHRARHEWRPRLLRRLSRGLSVIACRVLSCRSRAVELKLSS